MAGQEPIDMSELKNKINAMNEYTLIVQEYFVKRVESFLDIYGKEVFGIEHYYVRFEFAKSRGQIHAHLIAILGKNSKLISFNDMAYQYRHDLDKQANYLDQWMTEVLGLTGIFPGSDSHDNISQADIVPPEGYAKVKPDVHPSSKKLSSIINLNQDNKDLCNYCQMHCCSDYCLRSNRKKRTSDDLNLPKPNPKKRRVCRFGAGEEFKYGEADTPGFKLLIKPTIISEGHSLHKKKMFLCKRNTKRMNQTSLFLAQIWRGNTDIKPLLYFSDPKVPDVEDIVSVVDYIVGYTMKGAETSAIEQKNIRNFITNYVDDTNDTSGLCTLARKWLNSASTSRTISKQEGSFLLSGLPLTLCSEHLEFVSTSRKKKFSNI